MKSKAKRPKISLLHDVIPAHVQEYMQLTRLAEMGRMAASVAHEINNPLMIAQGFAENIEMMLAKPELSRDEIRLQVVEITKACQRMSRIINKMNRMSRQQKLRLHVVDVAEVALNAVDFLKGQAAELDVQLEFEFSRPLPIKCDVVQVEQIVLNILSNALSALESRNDQRRIRISFSEIGKDWQQIKIWNNGPPIPESIKVEIMAGTGLGLSVCKAIMEVHGGDLSFSSSLEHGTEFVLSFPRPHSNPWEARTRSDCGPIFVLDPQANYRRTLEEKFRLLGFEVHAYSDNALGLAKIMSSSSVGAVLVDMVPGQGEGIAFIEKLRQQLGPQGLIFTMSHFPSARDLKSDLKGAGANECFEKPIHADNFSFILKLLDAPTFAAQDKRTS